jgi:hypothetical protein
MAKTLFAISAAALLVSFAAGWAVSRTQAGVAEATVQIDTFQLMTNAKQMPAEHFADYSFVY